MAMSPEESAFYQRLFESVDVSGSGVVSAQAGADFLSRSGLPRQTLGTIWGVADSMQEGVLTREGFFAAMRLVAHAQSGAFVSPELVAIAPPGPPQFQGGAPSQAMPPNTSLSIISSSTASSMSRPPSWAPSQREKRKYASLFLRTDTDRDGYIEPAEAKALCDRSGLDEAELAAAWSHADQDRDNRLNFPEFVALVHLVTCRTRGLMIPGAHEGPPAALAASLATLEHPELLHEQRSRSPSRMGSSTPATSRSVSPAPAADYGDDSGGFEAMACGGGGHGVRGSREEQQARSRPGFIVDGGGCGDGGLLIDTSEDALAPSRGGGSSPSMPSSPCSPRFGDERDLDARPMGEANLDVVKRHLRGIRDGDRVLRKHVQQEIAALEEKLQAARAAAARAKPQAERERDEERRLRTMAEQLEDQLAGASQRLIARHGDGHALRSQMGSLDLVRDTRKLLQEAFEEERRLLEDMERSNRFLHKSCDALAQELADFSRVRAEVYDQLIRERQLLDRAHRRKEELLANAERCGLRQAGMSGFSSSAPSPDVRMGGARESPTRVEQPHSWASTLVGGAFGVDPRAGTGSGLAIVGMAPLPRRAGV